MYSEKKGMPCYMEIKGNKPNSLSRSTQRKERFKKKKKGEVKKIKSSGKTLTGARSDSEILSSLNSQISWEGLLLNQEVEG